ncbi:fluoride efflux transporter CrcB [Bacillus sp. CECT 9360]|uniref:fluoride efflux transporter CrcB n=1 Tax=Bacillus sp. CECT 9360 TaxID=2845821 RepID=UPI001E28FC5F|nr:fluoride efflux transporter CrcB [Bacillus sp. CECT 9360]CAH0344291.1 Putative fluoride ion transporter CrcB [Bacillus sp. CECT 9360]
MKLVLIMLGGFLGSVCRFFIGEWLPVQYGFPVATFCINLVGCFFLGWLLSFSAYKKRMDPHFVLFLGTGFIGSFTTFSTFSLETIRLVGKGHIVMAVSYVLLSIFCGIFLAFAGKTFAKSFAFKKGETV